MVAVSRRDVVIVLVDGEYGGDSCWCLQRRFQVWIPLQPMWEARVWVSQVWIRSRLCHSLGGRAGARRRARARYGAGARLQFLLNLPVDLWDLACPCCGILAAMLQGKPMDVSHLLATGSRMVSCLRARHMWSERGDWWSAGTARGSAVSPAGVTAAWT